GIRRQVSVGLGRRPSSGGEQHQQTDLEQAPPSHSLIFSQAFRRYGPERYMPAPEFTRHRIDNKASRVYHRPNPRIGKTSSFGSQRGTELVGYPASLPNTLKEHSMVRRQTWAPWAALCAALFAVATNAAAQSSTTGTVVGTVSDPTGALVPKAEVQLTNVETNAVLNQTTNDSGGYVFPSVVPGMYKVSVRLAGFRTAEITNVTVEVNKSLELPVKLEVGGDREIVEVSATATAQLQT